MLRKVKNFRPALSFLKKNAIQNMTALFSGCFVLFCAFCVESKINQNYKEDLEKSVKHFQKISELFVKTPYLNEGEIEKNLNRFRNVLFWNTKHFSQEKDLFYFPIVVTRSGMNIEDKKLIHMDLSKTKTIKNNRLILRYSFPDERYFLIIPLKFHNNISFYIDNKENLVIPVSLSFLIHKYFLFLLITIFVVSIVISNIRKYFQKTGRKNLMTLHKKHRREIEDLKKRNQDLQSSLYSVQSNMCCFKNKTFKNAKDYLKLSEKSIKLFQEFQNSQEEFLFPKIQSSDYIMIYDVFRNEKIKLSDLWKEILKIFDDVMKEKNINISLEPFLGKIVFYGDKEIIFSSLYVVLQTIFYSSSFKKNKIIIHAEIKGVRLIISFLGIKFPLTELNTYKESNLFSIKNGTDNSLLITFEPFLSQRKKSLKKTIHNEISDNVVTLFKKN